MGSEKYKNRSTSNDFDLDDYINKMADQDLNENKYKDFEERDESSFKRNFIAIAIVIILSAVWLFTAGPFASNGTNTVEITEPVLPDLDFDFNDLAEIPVPPPPPVVEEFSTSYIDYLEAVNNRFPDEFSSPAVRAFYDANVSLDYLDALNAAGMADEFSFPAIVAFYSGDVPVEYLEQFKDAGLIGDYSFPAIVSFYGAEIPFQYLEALKENGFGDSFSFPAITAFYSAGVSFEYLKSLQNANYLDSFSFPAIIAFYEADVPVEFLNILAERDLLDTMSFPDIVNAYQADN